MIRKRYLALAFIAAASLLAPIHASALSVNDFEKETAQQQSDYYAQVVKDAILESYKINNQTGAAVEAYFTKLPSGASETKGFTAFDAELQTALQDGKAGKLDLDKSQIEDIVFDVIQTRILPTVAQNPPQPKP